MGIFDALRRALGGDSSHPSAKDSAGPTFTPWTITKDAIVRHYDFYGLAGPNSKTTFQVECRAALGSQGDVCWTVHFILVPALTQRDRVMQARLSTLEKEKDTGLFPIDVSHFEPGGNAFLSHDPETTSRLLDVLRALEPMQFELIDGTEVVLRLRLPNTDFGFRSNFVKLDSRIRFQGGSDSTSTFAKLGDECLERQDLNTAIEHYTAAIAEVPSNAQLYFKRAIVWSNRYHNLGKETRDLQNSINDQTRAIELDPQFGDAYFQRAGLWSQSGLPQKAIDDYTRAIEAGAKRTRPEDSYSGRARMYQRLGDAGKAVADFTKALELCRPVDRALAHFSRAQVLLEADNFDSAILDFTSSIQANPMGLGCYQMRGQAFYGAGRFDSAISDFTYVIEKRPSDAEAYAWRGHCYAALGRERSAFQDFEHADKLGCDFSDLQTRLHADSPGAAALERFFERTRELDRTPPTPPPPTPRAALQPERHRPSAPPPITPAPPAPPGKVRVDWGDWTVVGKDLVRQYDFQNLPFAERLMLQIRLTVEMGSFGFPHTHPHMIMQPPISEEQEITRTVVVDCEDGSVEVGPLQVTVARVPDDASLIWFFGDGYKKFLTVLWSMKRIRFLLLEPDGRTIQMALPLETGPDYRDAFSRIQNQVTGSH